jgi:dolichol-phosphate mannosyltransferase
MKKVFVSIVMPALNEEKNIVAAIDNTLKAFDDYGIEGEIIIINDGSKDKTRDLVSDAMSKENRLKLINHDAPQGIGASFWDGTDEAMGDIVTMLPGDNENDPWEILRYSMLLEHVDIVIPFVFNKEVRSLFRNALSFIYRFIINTTFLVNFNYTNGTILYRKTILKNLDYRSRGFFFQTDILIRTVKRGYLFAEVPYRLSLRNSGVSKAVSFPSLVKVIKGYFRLVRDMYFNASGNIKKDFAKGSLTKERRRSLD